MKRRKAERNETYEVEAPTTPGPSAPKGGSTRIRLNEKQGICYLSVLVALSRCMVEMMFPSVPSRWSISTGTSRF